MLRSRACRGASPFCSPPPSPGSPRCSSSIRSRRTCAITGSRINAPSLGIPFFGDVVSNIPFLIAGVAGLRLLGRADDDARTPFSDPRERLPFLVFFLGIALTGAGSTWYHLDPNNETLIWDRLPMTLAFMGFFAAMVSERIDRRLGRNLLAPLVVLGALSVAIWAWTEANGHGDLRFYALVQFYPIVATVILLALFPTPYTHGRAYGIAIGFYVAAKLTEILDRQIMDVLRVVSGHNLKHVLAAGGAWCVLRMIRQRDTLSPPQQSSHKRPVPND